MLMIGLMHKVRALGLGKLLSTMLPLLPIGFLFLIMIINIEILFFKIINHEAINTD